MSKLYLATDDALAVLTIRQDDCQYDLHLRSRSAQCVAVDSLRPELLYCGTFGNGLWRSQDAGWNWQLADAGITHSKVLGERCG